MERLVVVDYSDSLEPVYVPFTDSMEFIEASRVHGPYVTPIITEDYIKDGERAFFLPKQVLYYGIRIESFPNLLTYKDLFKKWQFADLTCCGKLKQE